VLRKKLLLPKAANNHMENNIKKLDFHDTPLLVKSAVKGGHNGTVG
jgi:hypothetical protein